MTTEHSVQVLWQEVRRAYAGEVIPYEVAEAKRELDGLEEQLEAVREELSDMAQIAYEGNEREKVLEEQLEVYERTLRAIASYANDPNEQEIHEEAAVAWGQNELAKIAQAALNPATKPSDGKTETIYHGSIPAKRPL